MSETTESWPEGAPPRGYILAPGTRVVSRLIRPDLMAVKVSAPPRSEQRYALFELNPKKLWSATGETLTLEAVRARLHDELLRQTPQA